MEIELKTFEVSGYKAFSAYRYGADCRPTRFGTAVCLTIKYQVPTTNGSMTSSERARVNG